MKINGLTPEQQQHVKFLEEVCMTLGIYQAHDYDGIESPEDIENYQKVILKKIERLKVTTLEITDLLADFDEDGLHDVITDYTVEDLEGMLNADIPLDKYNLLRVMIENLNGAKKFAEAITLLSRSHQD